ncbi:MAG TPA: FecR family protein [Candidatus Polarisedimenticolia bacterium]|nr:FecR family protein [Candidatus Polarisedimenticolia bacterium]
MNSFDEAGGGRRAISDADLEALLRATGARPEAPSERAERVRRAAHAVFRTQAARAVRRRRLTWGLALATAALLVAGAALPVVLGVGPGSPEVARVTRVSGQASIRSGGFLLPRTAPALTGGPVRAHNEVITAPDGALAFEMAGGGSVRLAPGSRARLPEARVVELERGTLYVDSEQGRAAGAEPIEIRTPLGRVLEKGTQFEVRLLEDALRVRVRRGAVQMRRGAAGIDVAAGQELEVDARGGTRSGEIPAYDTEWSWAGNIAPPMAIQGRTLREFLDWAALESGLRLQFADEELGTSASTIVLSGSIEGLTLDQALDSVLLTSRMTRKVETDTLRIERLAPAEPPR